ncbi:MAG TPA: response regulator [Marinagarivorans sp.]
MFDALERKLLIDTVSKRCAWLTKTLDEGTLDDKAQQEQKAVLKALGTALKKLEATAPTKSIAKAPSKPTAMPPPKKTRQYTLPIDEAHVLIAEDDPGSAALLEGLLRDIGVKSIEFARDGRQAVSMLKNASPTFDIVLCDWNMPELTGLEVKKQVRNLARLQDTHFIMVTAVTESTRIKEAIGEGITDYIIKPIDGTILEKKIKSALTGINDDSDADPMP